MALVSLNQLSSALGFFFSRFFNISIYNVMSKTTSIMYKTQTVSSLKTAFQYVGWRGEGTPLCDLSNET